LPSSSPPPPSLSPATVRRAAAFAALGDPTRLAIVDLLALDDRAPSELGAALGIGSNLVAHHLAVLEAAGLVVRHRSAGDGRRRYVGLGPAVPDGVVAPARLAASRVVFVCRHNAARSPFAAALWATCSPVPATSAGASPAAAVHPAAVAAARRYGVDLSGHRPRGYAACGAPVTTSTAPSDPWLVVSVCDVAFEDDPPLAAALRLHWSVPDPLSDPGAPSCDTAFADIAGRIARLATVVGAAEANEAPAGDVRSREG